jgi:preprotein translocase subunit YajC
MLLLAQDAPTGAPTEAAPLQGAPGSPQGGQGAPPPGAGDAFGGYFFPIMLGLLLFMIVITVMGPRREKKKRETMMAALKKHDKVQTVGGVIGSIVELKPDYIVLKVDESANTRITFAKSAIQQVIASRGEKAPTADESE